MGHLVNPVSMRLSVNSFWSSNWVLINNFNYVNLFKKDYLLFHFLNWFIKKSKFLKFNILVSHYKIYRVTNRTYINLYYYNGSTEDNNYYFQVLALNNVMKKGVLKNKSDNLNFNLKMKNIYEYIFKALIFNLYWRVINQSLIPYFNSIDRKQTIFYLNIYALDFLNITVDSIASYISLKLQKRYSLNWILRPILKDLSMKVKQKNFLGYKIVCSGRFTRKQIATYMWMRNGSLKLNNISNLIKYSETRVRLKYGLCGIKIWINYDNNNLDLLKRNLFLIYPIYTPFKYVINLKKENIVIYLNNWFFFFIRVMFLKLKSYSFYKNFLIIKLKLLLNILTKQLFGKPYLHKYNIQLLAKNKIEITKVSSLKSLNYKSIYLYKDFNKKKYLKL